MSDIQEESNLFEIFQPVVRRWKLLFAGVLAAVFIAALVSVLSTKQYETSMLLQIGSVMDKQIEDSNTVVDIVNSDAFHQAVATKLGVNATPKQLSSMIRAETNTNRQSPLVNITVVSDTPERNIQLANAVFDVLDKRHKPMFEEKIEYYRDYRKVLEEKTKAYNQELLDLKQELNSLNSDSKVDLAGKILLQTRVNDRETQSLSLTRELRELSAYFTNIHSHNTNMVAKPILPRKPARPNLKLNLAIAFLVGFFVMISFILVADQYKNSSAHI